MAEVKDASLEELKKDLQFQLTFEEIDWDYFLETAERARNQANVEEQNFAM